MLALTRARAIARPVNRSLTRGYVAASQTHRATEAPNFGQKKGYPIIDHEFDAVVV
ncbi:hypothetical protein I350_02424 [Cryptococcus amylolentus CBS 6273]|nr:hypothetical protein I350_02424 [Cryptococcus amylolentus CBS 6273]